MTRLTQIRDIQLEVDVTPPAWELPRRGESDDYVSVLRVMFPEMIHYLLGAREVTVRLHAVREWPLAHVSERARRTRVAFWALRDRLLRERTVDSGERERMRDAALARVEVKATASESATDSEVRETPLRSPPHPRV